MKDSYVAALMVVVAVGGMAGALKVFEHVTCEERYGENACILYDYEVAKLEILKGYDTKRRELLSEILRWPGRIDQ